MERPEPAGDLSAGRRVGRVQRTGAARVAVDEPYQVVFALQLAPVDQVADGGAVRLLERVAGRAAEVLVDGEGGGHVGGPHRYGEVGLAGGAEWTAAGRRSESSPSCETTIPTTAATASTATIPPPTVAVLLRLALAFSRSRSSRIRSRAVRCPSRFLSLTLVLTRRTCRGRALCGPRQVNSPERASLERATRACVRPRPVRRPGSGRRRSRPPGRASRPRPAGA